MLEQLFNHSADWQQRDAAFYRCELRDVTPELATAFLREVTGRMRTITGLPLTDRVVVTAQQMQPGQFIGIHSDRPLLGYESVRLVVQLNKDWQPAHGGVLELFASPSGEAVMRVPPGYNEAFGFVLHKDSHHAVTQVSRARLSVVFNFWHAANTPELATHVQTLFTKLHFSELSTTLHPVMTAAEETLPEDTTLLAGTTAVALQRWGYDDATVMAGYQYSAGQSSHRNSDKEAWAAIRLADWVARLHRDSFDLARWEELRSELHREQQGGAEFTRLVPTWRLCLPEQDRA
ncbi:MAG: 2OG-Fe(II) oxygenase [Gammaproteobacteria bacterium]|nr:2OG-Fe(II) oxygenase [Gammaproteobacteria bacterium]MDH5799535.1 2OG-Fe(II) oxygenase [Gammaproteobacteria bacterium]